MLGENLMEGGRGFGKPLLKFIGLFTLSHSGNQNQQGGCVPLMWPAALCNGLAALSCGLAEL